MGRRLSRSGRVTFLVVIARTLRTFDFWWQRVKQESQAERRRFEARSRIRTLDEVRRQMAELRGIMEGEDGPASLNRLLDLVEPLTLIAGPAAGGLSPAANPAPSSSSSGPLVGGSSASTSRLTVSTSSGHLVSAPAQLTPPRHRPHATPQAAPGVAVPPPAQAAASSTHASSARGARREPSPPALVPTTLPGRSNPALLAAPAGAAALNVPGQLPARGPGGTRWSPARVPPAFLSRQPLPLPAARPRPASRFDQLLPYAAPTIPGTFAGLPVAGCCTRSRSAACLGVSRSPCPSPQLRGSPAGGHCPAPRSQLRSAAKPAPLQCQPRRPHHLSAAGWCVWQR